MNATMILSSIIIVSLIFSIYCWVRHTDIQENQFKSKDDLTSGKSKEGDDK